MNRKTVKIISALIAAAFILGLFGPLAYNLVFSVPMDDGQSLEAQIEELKLQLEENEKRIAATEELGQKIIEESGNRFRIMCEKGMLSYLDIIFSAEDMTDFADRLVIARELAEYDKNMMSTIKKIQQDAKAAAEKSKELLAELEEKRAELETENEDTVSQEQN
ncbi:MAG: hypothetical protein IJA16_03830 [Clostridia bacterium]|nr:hypothetical protein [Clostridia bacterium]